VGSARKAKMKEDMTVKKDPARKLPAKPRKRL